MTVVRSLAASVLVVGVVVTLASCTGGGEDSDDTGPGRLSALYNEYGHLDCRRLYYEAPVVTLLDAGLTTDLNSSESSDGNNSGNSYCPSRYVGPEWPGSIAVPFYTGTSADGSRYTWEGEPEQYRGWEIGQLNMAGGAVSPAAMTTVEGHGTFLVFTPAEYELDAAPGHEIPNPLGDSVGDALRHVVDGLEDHAHDLAPEGTVNVFSDGDRFDCRNFYEQMTATDLLDEGLDVSDERYAKEQVLERENSAESCDLVTVNGINGDSDIAGTGMMVPPVEITTGPKNDHPGTPLEGDASLSGWEEYWDFAGADRPVNITNDGKEAYTARFCRSEQDCISVSNFLGYKESGNGRSINPTAQTIKDEITPLLRWINEQENLSDLTDGAE